MVSSWVAEAHVGGINHATEGGVTVGFPGASGTVSKPATVTIDVSGELQAAEK